ncbi:MAG: arylesterase [Chitinophagaceae bacterium]
MNNIISYILVALLLIANTGCKNDDKAAKKGNDKAATEDTVTMSRSVKTILFYGNSLTAGYGLDDPSEAFPTLIQAFIDSLQLPYRTVNAGVSGETTSGGDSRVEWVLRQQVDVFVLELGANDGLRGIPVTETKKNLQSIIDKVIAKYPLVKLVLAGMEVPPNMGKKYAADFRSIFPDLAARNKIPLITFLLNGVGGEVALNQRDGIHPTAAGHKIVADNVWMILKDVLK